jgi:hypothetical protein
MGTWPLMSPGGVGVAVMLVVDTTDGVALVSGVSEGVDTRGVGVLSTDAVGVNHASTEAVSVASQQVWLLA